MLAAHAFRDQETPEPKRELTDQYHKGIKSVRKLERVENPWFRRFLRHPAAPKYERRHSWVQAANSLGPGSAGKPERLAIQRSQSTVEEAEPLERGDENRETEIGIWGVRALVTNTVNPRKHFWAENQRDDSWDRVGFDWCAHFGGSGFGNQHGNWNGAIRHSQWQWRV